MQSSLGWYRLFDRLSHLDAMKRERKIKSDEAKLRKFGCGNYADVRVQLQFEGPGKKEYAVWVRKA